jgi:ketosteroid isomerase-like protein
MSHKSIQSLALATLIMLFSSCSQVLAEETKDAEVREIAKTIDSCIGWFRNKDFDLLFSVVWHDSNYISVRPSSTVIRGFEQFERSSEVFKNPDFVYVRHELKDLTINRSKSGDVAWFYCVLDDINEWNGQPANWENVRWTGVLEKRNEKWVIVQQHFSFASDN